MKHNMKKISVNIQSSKKMTKQFSNDNNASSSSTGNSKEDRRKRRLELNRKAAQLSRQRKKQRVQSLEQNVAVLKRENRELRVVNDTLRNLLSAVGKSQNPTQSDSVAVQSGTNKSTEVIRKDMEKLKVSKE